MARISVFSEGITLSGAPGLDEIEDCAASAARVLSLDHVSFTVVITDNRYIREINKKYRNIDEPTDVIAFAAREEPFPEIDIEDEEMGDIFISLEQAEEQSRQYGSSLTEEMKRLLVHGLLHLMGYDHEQSEEGAARMLEKEEEVLRQL